jgi:hypothetical protein
MKNRARKRERNTTEDMDISSGVWVDEKVDSYISERSLGIERVMSDLVMTGCV